MAAVRVFVSYSWDSDEHRTWVRNLCSRLVSDGVQVRLDQWYVRAGDSFMKFMEEEIRLAEIVVVVCTPKYARKVNSRTGGVGFEGQIISSVLFKKAALKCIPIVVAGTTEPGPDYAIPSFLEGVAAIFFDSIDDADFSYEELLRAILEKPRYAPPPLGEPPELLSDSELKWGPSGGRRVAAELDYSSALNIDFSTVAAAIDAIQALGNSQTWPDFRDTRPDGLWMKSESDALVNTLYALWAPMVQFSLERTSCERRYAGFDWRSRLQVLIMAAIVNVYQDDSTIACIEPGLTYSPRVPQWRLKREGEPARYWWQGLSDERFARAVREFLTRSSAEEPLPGPSGSASVKASPSSCPRC